MEKLHYPSLLAACAILSLGVNPAVGSGLYFTTSGDDLIVTAREADNSRQFWSLTIAQGAAATPGEGAKGAITGFYDLSGAPGSDASFNIAKGHLLGTYFTRGVGGTATILQSDSTAVLTAPEGIDGASSYTFSVTGAFTDYDESSSAMATFTSTITLNAPTLEGTFFTVSNTLQTPADWVTGSTLAEGGRASQSGLATFMEAMEGGMVEFYNGWTDSPRSPTQWARLTATGDSIGYAQGRSFYLEQTANVATIGTSENYVPVSASPSSMVLTQMLSGTYRGHAAPDSFYSSDGFLDINIIVPEPSTYAALAGLAVFAVAVIRRRKRAL